MTHSQITSKEKLNSLIELYKMTREEIGFHIRNYYRIVSFFGALMAILSSISFLAEKYFDTLFLFIPFLIIVALALVIRTSLTTNHIRFFLIFLERQINKELGSEAFIWEKEYVGLHYGANRIFYTPLLVIFAVVIAIPPLLLYGYIIYRIFHVYIDFSRNFYILLLIIFYVLALVLLPALYYVSKRRQNKRYKEWLARKLD